MAKKRRKQRGGTAGGVGASEAGTGISAQVVEITGPSGTTFGLGRWIGGDEELRGWTEDDLRGKVKDNSRARALLSGNHLAEGITRASEDWMWVVYLHWSTCVMCGKLHHSLMMHILDEEGKVVAISPTAYERKKHE